MAMASVELGGEKQVLGDETQPQYPRHIVLRSSWQMVNIGDIAHTPGMLTLLEKQLPEARITLWPTELSAEVEQILRARFPQLSVARSRREQQQLLQDCDFMLHGSGPSLTAARELGEWRATGKPYGIGGVTLRDEEIEANRALLNGAKFIFCRHVVFKSVERLRHHRAADGVWPGRHFSY